MSWAFFITVLVGMSGILAWLAVLHRTLGHLKTSIHELKKNSFPPPSTVMETATSVQAPAPHFTSAGVPRRIIHDMNNYLGTVSGFTDAALEDISEESPVYGDLSEIREAARKAKEVIKALDAISKAAENGSQKIPRSNSIGADDFNDRPTLSKKPYPSISTAAADPRLMPSKTSGMRFTSVDAYRRSFSAIPADDIPTGTEHLFIVDDEAQLLRMFRRFFEPLGYKVTTFANSLEAKEAFQQKFNEYDLAIVDQRMPDLSGANLAVEMLAIRPDMPIILLSGYSDTISPADATRIGIRRFLSKPIPQVELSATVRSVLDEQPRYSV